MKQLRSPLPPPASCKTLLLVVVLAAVLFPGDSWAQRVDTVRVAVDDGVELLTMVHRPPGPGPHPAVLLRNPYRTRGGAMGWLVERLVPHGYAVVEQDVRGTGGSAGDFVPFLFEVADGTATLDWLGAEDWAGPVALWGISYQGWAAYALAETGHPAVSALVAGSAWGDMDPLLYPGGAFNLMAHLTWFRGFASGGGMPSAAELDSLFRALPLESVLGGAAPTMTAVPPFDWDAVSVPVLHFTGWHDYIYTHSLAGYEALRARRGADGSQHLIVGPWAHNDELRGATRVGDTDFGPAAAAGPDSVAAWTLRFLDIHLGDQPVVDPLARVFVMGENAWRSFADWPPPGAQLLTWYLTARGRLADSSSRRRSTTVFRYDPADPMPTLGGANSHFFPHLLGPLDQRPLDGRRDVARFITSPLDRPLVMAGPLRATLYLDADAPSTDVAVKLMAVTPDGAARLIEDGIRRLDELTPGVNQVTITLGQRALRLEPGTRLRLDVTGGNFPKYDRNPNTGEDPWVATELRPVRIRLHHGGVTPARLELTVVPED